jgi:hypothetical protein
MNRFVLAAVAAVSLVLPGCAKHSRVVVNPDSQIVLKSAYVVLHGGNSEDMDAHVQQELTAHGLQVKAGPGIRETGTDVVVRYTDNWHWDMSMYLRLLDIQVYDGASGTLLASGSWKNSALHGYHSAGKVTKKVMDEVFAKLDAG